MSDSAIMVLLAASAAVLGILLLRTIRAGGASKASAGRESRPKRRKPSASAPKPAPPPPNDSSEEEEPADIAVPAAVREDRDLELTKLSLPTLERDEQTSEWRPTTKQAVVPIVFDDEAAVDQPTQPSAFILVSAVGQTDQGRKRRRNEDSYLILDDPPLFVVADGMGGYAGGDIASALAVEAIAHTFSANEFEALYPGLPRRGSELVQAIQSANQCIFEAAQADESLKDMGTTIVCARFTPHKERLYLGHVGDSRCYVMRDGTLHQITTDHIAANEGISGPLGQTLTRALGIAEGVVVDLILGKPRAGDRYLLCSDGLSKMVSDEEIAALLEAHLEPAAAVSALIDAANAHGGKDNVTVILVRIDSRGLTAEADR